MCVYQYRFFRVGVLVCLKLTVKIFVSLPHLVTISVISVSGIPLSKSNSIKNWVSLVTRTLGEVAGPAYTSVVIALMNFVAAISLPPTGSATIVSRLYATVPRGIVSFPSPRIPE